MRNPSTQEYLAAIRKRQKDFVCSSSLPTFCSTTPDPNQKRQHSLWSWTSTNVHFKTCPTTL